MKKTIAVAILAAIGSVGPLGCAQEAKAPETRATFDFNDAKAGETPKGWSVAETKGEGNPAKWRVEAVEGDAARKNALKVDSRNKEAVFNLLLSEKTYAADLTLSVKIKAATGEDDRGGGLVWRVKDADNYYVTRWNPLEKNIRLYKVEEGKRTTLKSADTGADPAVWHDIKVEHHGKQIKVLVDGKELLSAEDETFKDGGKVGFWTKADASSWFDDLVIEWKK